MHPPLTPIADIASRRVRSFGAASVAELASAEFEDGMRLSPGEARERLRGIEAHFVDDDWFWLPAGARDRLPVLTRRVLAVTSPLELGAVRAGISRSYRRRLAFLVPPARVLQAYYSAHPEFEIDDHDRVRPTAQLDYRTELGKADRLFVEVLRSSWTGFLDRAAFLEACTTHGMSRHVFSFATAYSPVLDHPAPDAWCLRGTRFSPIIVAALRHAKGSRAGDR